MGWWAYCYWLKDCCWLKDRCFQDWFLLWLEITALVSPSFFLWKLLENFLTLLELLLELLVELVIFPLFKPSSTLIPTATKSEKLAVMLPTILSNNYGRTVSTNQSASSFSVKGGSTWDAVPLHLWAYSLNDSESFWDMLKSCLLSGARSMLYLYCWIKASARS